MLLIGPPLPLSLPAQVFEVGGGTSSLVQGSGGSITTHAASYDLTLGAGSLQGHLVEGARLVKATPQAKYIIGDNQIAFQLPTDIFDASHFLLARGVGVQTTHNGTNTLAFAGATATAYSSPFFTGATTDNFTGVLFVQKKLGPRLQLFSDTIVASKPTGIAALAWSPLPKLDLALSAGAGADQPYAASSLRFSRRWIDGEAAYIQAGQQFHRVALAAPLQAEPDRENLLATVRPFSFLHFTAARQNYLVPQDLVAANGHSSINQASTGLHLFAVQLNGTIFRSTYQGQSNSAGSFSATRDITSRFRAAANFLASRPRDAAHSNSLISTISETITQRLALNQNVTTSAGQTGITFGGQILSNFVTLSANYETYFVPASLRSFQQALVFDVRLNLFGHLVLHGGSFVDPTGHIRATVDASTLVWHGQSAHPVSERISLEPAIMTGCVVDSNHDPVDGAALMIDKRTVYAGSDGCFFLRERRPATHSLQVLGKEFLGGGNWQVVSAPPTIASTLDTASSQPPIVVVVTLVRPATSTVNPPAGAPQ
jgi:hypothetical protein